MVLAWVAKAEGLVLPEVTHLLHVEHSRAVVEALTAFLARHPVKAPLTITASVSTRRTARALPSPQAPVVARGVLKERRRGMGEWRAVVEGAVSAQLLEHSVNT